MAVRRLLSSSSSFSSSSSSTSLASVVLGHSKLKPGFASSSLSPSSPSLSSSSSFSCSSFLFTRVCLRSKLGPPAAAVVSFAPVRHFGLIGDLKDKLAEKSAAKQEKTTKQKFEELREILLKKNDFTYNDSLELMQKNADDLGIDGALFGVKKLVSGNKIDEKPIKQAIGVLQALTPAERNSSEPLAFLTKKRLVNEAKFSVHDVAQVERMTIVHKKFQRWLKRRVKVGLPLPSSTEEVQHMMKTDRPEMTWQEKEKLRVTR